MKRNERDLYADLAICNAATAGPWTIGYGRGNSDDKFDVDGAEQCITALGPICTGHNHWDGPFIDVPDDDARFIAEARTGWPHAIERALAAEAEVERLRENLQAVFEAFLEALEYVPGEMDVVCQRIVEKLRADIYGEEAIE